MDTFGDRLREERKRLGLTQTDFAAISGQKKQSQVRYESGERSPDGNYFAALAEADVDVMYILTGTREEETIAKLHGAVHEEVTAEILPPEREAFALSQVGEDVGQRHAENKPVLQDGEAVELSNFSLVSLFDIGLSAGPGLVPIKDAEVGHIAVSRHWLRQHNLSAKNCAMVRVCGDSMSPTVPDGSWVLIDAAETQVVREGVFAFSREGEAFIKRFVPVEGGETGSPNALVIVSDNPAIPPETVAGQELNTLRVVGRVRSVLTDL